MTPFTLSYRNYSQPVAISRLEPTAETHKNLNPIKTYLTERSPRLGAMQRCRGVFFNLIKKIA